MSASVLFQAVVNNWLHQMDLCL